MSSFENYKQKKQVFLDLAGLEPGATNARCAVQAAREMVLAEMEHKACQEYARGPLFGLPREWVKWLLNGGTKK